MDSLIMPRRRDWVTYRAALNFEAQTLVSLPLEFTSNANWIEFARPAPGKNMCPGWWASRSLRVTAQ